MARYAIVNNATHFVVNVIEWDGVSSWEPPDGCSAILDTNGAAEIGGTYIAPNFSPAPDPEVPDPQPLTLTERVEVLETDWADEGVMRADIVAQLSGLQANLGALAFSLDSLTIPSPATAAAADPAAAATVGVAVKFAREDHKHKKQDIPEASDANPQTLATVASSGTGAKFARDDHKHGIPIVTPTTGTSRAIGTAWTPSADKPVLVVATVRISVTSTIGGASEAAIEMRSDSAATPTTRRCRAQNRATVSLAAILQVVDEKTFTLVHLVPAGEKVILVKSVNTGTNTTTLEEVTETVIG